IDRSGRGRRMLISRSWTERWAVEPLHPTAARRPRMPRGLSLIRESSEGNTTHDQRCRDRERERATGSTTRPEWSDPLIETYPLPDDRPRSVGLDRYHQDRPNHPPTSAAVLSLP